MIGTQVPWLPKAFRHKPHCLYAGQVCRNCSLLTKAQGQAEGQGTHDKETEPA